MLRCRAGNPAGWQLATGFTPNTDGAYTCGESAIKISGLPSAVQPSNVGLNLSDLK